GDMFRTTDDTIVRDVLEEGEIQTQSVLRQGEDIPLGPAAADLAEPPAPRSATDEIPTVPTATGQQPLDTSALGREAEPLSTDRPIDDLGGPADEAVDRAAQPLAVDAPVEQASDGALIVQRVEEPGKTPSFDRPQGLYTSPADIESPHLDLGGD